MKKLITVTFVIILLPFASKSQQVKNLVQFSGVVVTSDSLQPIPFASVLIKHTNRGTITDYYGFFSFVAIKGDTVEFNYLGYKKSQYIISDTLPDERYSLIQLLVRDTVMLKEAVIYPWPTKEEFRKAFVELKVPDDDMKRAERNIASAYRKDVIENVGYDGNINYKYTLQQQQSRLYNAGQYPVNNLLNPVAWANFIQAWKDGAFKKKEED